MSDSDRFAHPLPVSTEDKPWRLLKVNNARVVLEPASMGAHVAPRCSTPRFLPLQKDIEMADSQTDRQDESRLFSNSKSTVVLPFASPAKTNGSIDYGQSELVNSNSRVTLGEDKRLFVTTSMTGSRLPYGLE
jgi:hypothetical protein